MRRPASKYRAKPTVVDGIRFHSQKEARRYQELKLLERAGQIQCLLLQPVYHLYVVPIGQKPVILGKYVGDFQYEECDHANGHRGWRKVVEDVKGFKTPLYKWKKKHIEAHYGIQIREV
jgi:hypothetical protein